MIKVIVEATNIISSLGFTTEENVTNVLKEKSGLEICNDELLTQVPIPLSQINKQRLEQELHFLDNSKNYTFFEKICILTLTKALKESQVSIDDKKTILILSTTKGNIELLNESNSGLYPLERATLWKTANIIGKHFGVQNTPIVISNACISGVNAIILGQRLIQNGTYNNAVIIGADVLSKFVISGFQSFMSLSSDICKPFDAARNGLNIGEAAATIILTKETENQKNINIEVIQGSINNDANHISGPSRTGEGLFLAIRNTIPENITIDCISAHGTATPFNDDMESKAITRAHLQNVPVNSLKAYFGHTLGAAGVVESIISIEALKQNMLLKTLGYSNFGVAEQITISDKTEKKQLHTLLKVASGFGGCNAAVLFKKHE